VHADSGTWSGVQHLMTADSMRASAAAHRKPAGQVDPGTDDRTKEKINRDLIQTTLQMTRSDRIAAGGPGIGPMLVHARWTK